MCPLLKVKELPAVFQPKPTFLGVLSYLALCLVMGQVSSAPWLPSLFSWVVSGYDLREEWPCSNGYCDISVSCDISLACLVIQSRDLKEEPRR